MSLSTLSSKDKSVLLFLVARTSENGGAGSTSREIADGCDLDIYGARYTLLKLVSLGYVERCNAPGAKKHSWVSIMESVSLHFLLEIESAQSVCLAN